MQLIYGNLFAPKTYRYANGSMVGISPSAIVITTNGATKNSGEAIMGKGCAKQAASMDPRLPLRLGKAIKENGNNVQAIGTLCGLYRVVSFPVKPVSEVCAPDKRNVVKHMQNKMRVGQLVPGWACIASVKLIKRSAQQLVALVEKNKWAKTVLPRPGIGAGQLLWEDVRPILDSILDDTFYCITFGRK